MSKGDDEYEFRGDPGIHTRRLHLLISDNQLLKMLRLTSLLPVLLTLTATSITAHGSHGDIAAGLGDIDNRNYMQKHVSTTIDLSDLDINSYSWLSYLTYRPRKNTT